MVLFKALDHGLAPDEERSLHPSLENLIEQLTLVQDDPSTDCDDEGIERDSCEVEDANTLSLSQSNLQSVTTDTSTTTTTTSSSCSSSNINSTCTSTSCGTSSSAPPSQSSNGHNVTFSTIIKLCTSHLPNPNQADIHYSAICSSLYAETQELDAFLVQVSRGTNQLNCPSSGDAFDSGSTKLDDIKFRDWARLWIQVIRDLKDGVKLKKVNSCRTKKKSDFDLTPYEKLLEDIRSQNYNLTHIDPNSLEKIKKDAHALILESIRSKPALVPVSKRILPPLPVTVATIHEKLMQDIRQPHTLKPIQPRVSQGSNCLGKVCESSANGICSLAGRRKSLITCNSNESTPSPRRRLIKADIDLTLSCTIDGQSFNALQSPHLKGDEEMTDDVFYNNASNKSRNLRMKHHQPLEGNVDDDEVENDTHYNSDGRSQSNYVIGRLNMANNNSGNNNNTAGNKNSNNNNNSNNRSLDRKNSSFLLKALSRIWNLDLRY